MAMTAYEGSTRSLFGSEDRVLVSRDSGASWSELEFGEDARQDPDTPWLVTLRSPSNVLVSGDNIITLATDFTGVDWNILLDSQGLLPNGMLIGTIGGHETEDGQIVISFGLSDAIELQELSVLDFALMADPFFGQGQDVKIQQELNLTFDDLGITDEDLDEYYNDDVLTVWRNDGNYLRPVKTWKDTYSHDSAATGDGFILRVPVEDDFVASQNRAWTSTDGLEWVEREPDQLSGSHRAVWKEWDLIEQRASLPSTWNRSVFGDRVGRGGGLVALMIEQEPRWDDPIHAESSVPPGATPTDLSSSDSGAYAALESE